MNRKFFLVVLMLLALAALSDLRAQQPKSSHKKTSPEPKAEETTSAETEGPVKEDLKRLMLKDGSYQPVMKYQIIGDRVHYLSAERFQWEDVPSELVDWPASQKYAAEAQASNRTREVDEERAKEEAEEQARSPQVAPGIHLPETGGVFLLDVYQGKPELNELVQNGADVNKNMAGNILRGVINPIASAKQTVELKGPHANIQSHVGDPFLYVLVDQDENASNSPDPQVEKAHWKLVKVQEKRGNRIVGNVNIAIYGKVKEKANFVDVDISPVAGKWLKVAPAQPLQPGEYALVEMLGRNSMNRFVWDFGVNPTAGANPGSWKSEPAKTNVSGTDESPVLKKP